jgi:hypothetical protein
MGDSVEACSFCDKTRDEVRKLIQGAARGDVYICDECIDLCNDVIFGETPAIIRPFRMALRGLWWRITGRLPPLEERPTN